MANVRGTTVGGIFLVALAIAHGCASAEEGIFAGDADAGKDATASGGTGGKKDAGNDAKAGGGSGGVTGGGGSGGTGGSGGSGGGTCNPQTCPTPAAPAVKCCVTANGPCGVDYKQGAGCQVPSAGDI